MPMRGLSVLVIEDDRDHRELGRDMLPALGAHVTVAANGEEGVSPAAPRRSAQRDNRSRFLGLLAFSSPGDAAESGEADAEEKHG